MAFRTFIESSYSTLYNSAVAAFPHTTRRQHVVHEIDISNLHFVPYIGVRTLFIRGLAINTVEGTQYNPIITFKNVQFHNNGDLEITASDNGQNYRFNSLSSQDTHVLVRCQCKDFLYRFNYYDHVDDSLYGRVRKPYIAITNRGPINPEEMPGMCKHLMALHRELVDQHLL